MITVRLARPNQLSDIVAFGKKEYENTNYMPDYPFNSVLARRTVKAGMSHKDSRVWIAVRENGDICGLLIGQIWPGAWFAGTQATDITFIAAAGGDQLVDVFVHWCKLRGVNRIDMALTASNERKGVRRFFRRKGFKPGGGSYYLHLQPEKGDVLR